MRITLLSVLGSLFARNAAKHLAINQSVAADAVTAVNAAGHFAAAYRLGITVPSVEITSASVLIWIPPIV